MKVLVLILLVLQGALWGADEKGFTAIFNGKNFDDWDGKPEAWEVRNGEIWCTGKSQERTGLSGEKTSRPISFYGSNSVGTKVIQECRCVVMTWVSGRSLVIRRK